MVFKLSFFALFLSANLWGLTAISETFYKALYSESLTKIDAAIEDLESQQATTTNKAYKGALLMKKSDFLKTAAKKIELFKQGHQLLEAAIRKYPQNSEYRFIRLTIQEHAPKILKYNKNIEEDKTLVIQGYKKMSSATRSYILDYAGQSEVLTTKDLQ